MKTFLAVLNFAAFAVSFGAILWAWFVVRKDMRANAALLERLKEIERAYENEPAAVFGGGDRRAEMRAEQKAAGKTMFTYGDMNNMPELVKHLIYSHAISGLALQIWLVGAGLAIGTVANVMSLYV
ncbi:hypothetical protein [Paenarthrobacter sp. AB444]|uniref:hypothetical protein n=1 Tax=Paenarthrobacter sp. AB444 TaxID=3025681 RepID=UPI002365788B|nr:hypothetical protein [Paenarthrobacter sp. AB444]MDD7836404.1 hypothetical protein [Paenarthrobacter sp. AB444]